MYTRYAALGSLYSARASRFLHCRSGLPLVPDWMDRSFVVENNLHLEGMIVVTGWFFVCIMDGDKDVEGTRNMATATRNCSMTG